jgi:hypothetical protein
VKESDRVAVFDDGSPEMEHIVNLANANKRDLNWFREV